MTSTTIDMQVKSYMAAVAARLHDLPADERDDLMTDLEQHLHEVAAEADGTLNERLGSPESYAAELRASAGLADVGPVKTTGYLRRTAAEAKRQIAEVPVVGEIGRFLVDLRPGWWVLRAAIVVAAFDAGFVGDASTGSRMFFVFLGAVLLSVPSVLLGRAARHSKVARTVSIVGNIPTVIVAVALLSSVHFGYAEPEYYQETFMPDYLHHESGEPIWNVCAYDSKLQPLGDVLLFDQQGRPIDNVAYPWEAVAATESTNGFANAYPRIHRGVDVETGEQVDHPFTCPTLEKKTAKKKRD